MKDNIIKKATVLVVDAGDGTLSREIVDVLAGRVKDIKFAKNQNEGIQLFKEVLPQIVIVDMQHSLLNLVEFASKLKAMNYNAEIVVLLGFIEPHKLIELIDLGISRFVIKPVSVPKLTEAVEKAMNAVVDKALSYNSRYMQEILNAEDTPVFSTDGKNIVKANRAFLDCFGAKNLGQFCSTYSELKDVFEVEYDDVKSEMWFKEFLAVEEPKALVYDNRMGEKRVFLFKLGMLGAEKNYFVVTMADITETEASYIKKLEMLSSQMLSKEKIRFHSMLEFEVARCKRYKKIFSLITTKFEMREDVSTDVWDKIFKIARHILRSSDLFAKVDKDRLAIIATETDIGGANVVIERLKHEFDKIEREDGYKLGFKGFATEFDEKDNAKTIFARAVSSVA